MSLADDTYNAAAEQREAADAWLGDPREACEEDEYGQVRLSPAGEQRGFPGMSKGPEPAPTLDSTRERKHTRFEICERHRGWFAGATRERKAETFVEGGPGGISGCEGGVCRLWPGRDFYVAEVCRGEMQLDWVTTRG